MCLSFSTLGFQISFPSTQQSLAGFENSSKMSTSMRSLKRSKLSEILVAKVATSRRVPLSSSASEIVIIFMARCPKLACSTRHLSRPHICLPGAKEKLILESIIITRLHGKIELAESSRSLAPASLPVWALGSPGLLQWLGVGAAIHGHPLPLLWDSIEPILGA